eukprot:TRINITY_DN1902_c0_g1_i2.p1 TRINITY_DN1902_c0_g1~~TRINITY_DN1902_c0_g1_i2.p1  ORF type:complete len:100 (+),score=29.65 TRINITY_DN1902_c0_g1_i2:274-573(+)
MSKAVEDCRKEVFQLMKKDSFSRFRNSPDFKQWKQKLAAPTTMELGYVIEEEEEEEDEDNNNNATSSMGNATISRRNHRLDSTQRIRITSNNNLNKLRE